MALVEDRGLSEQVNDLLLEWIISSRLKAGERLKENELAEELGVSRTPVREALKTLAANGFVTILPRRGVFVSEIDDQRLEEVLDLRYLLEMYAAERGVGRIAQEELRVMRSLVEECEPITVHGGEQAYRQWLQEDRDLHRLIVETAGNSLLTELYETLAVFLQIARVRLSQWSPSMVKGHEEHKIILEAYEARDRDRLLRTLGSHLTRSRNEVIEVAARTVMGTPL